MDPTQTALTVAIPEAEPAVGPLRASPDPSHVTVLYPFLPPERIDERILSVIGDVVAAVPRFDVVFRRVGWFGDRVVWLAPEPDGPFRRLTAAMCRRFPETPPYGGEHTGSTPHLTVRHGEPRRLLDRAAEAVSTRLPIRATVASVQLVTGPPEPGPWRTLAEFLLGEPV
ncbi:2'-5' RNA ligase family protein [Actinoallomurus bryophytorum]|uniref:2'-5' RNA ligase superfamily protein n=1 Tax=Actinoallomurus bryophytorum TaxID=1490222 RepID=A0A543C1V4_9ACTN|nr:2'-5' RNA ligase family protein [Actinoallomurus bryophytorum]TQL91060.1 2'-5' RNA ligase superfamily protein [Actinoallomurus bryophytorum]